MEKLELWKSVAQSYLLYRWKQRRFIIQKDSLQLSSAWVVEYFAGLLKLTVGKTF